MFLGPNRRRLAVTLAVASVFSFAPARAAGPGTSAATFLSLGYGARPLGMGEAFVATADDVSAVHYNPAGLALPASGVLGMQPRRYEALFSQAIHIQDISLSQVGFVRRPFGFSLINLRVGDIERRTEETPESEGNFGASDTAIGLSYGRELGGLALGGTVKYIGQSIGGQGASSYAVDLGALKRLPGTPLSFGLGIANLGKPIRFIEQADPLPRTIRAGVTYGLTPKFPHAISLQFDLPRDAGPVIRLGAEYLGFGPFSLRAGYRTYSRRQRDVALGKALGSSASGLSEFTGMFLGLGFRSRLGTLDYSLLPYGELGNSHRLSLSVRFGQSP